ncbi:type II toxin-antitoxin system Phd/YefM family antitoxin, partial [Klebsiella pneumoniae]
MRTVNYSEARQNLADVLESAVTGVPVTITRPRAGGGPDGGAALDR